MDVRKTQEINNEEEEITDDEEEEQIGIYEDNENDIEDNYLNEDDKMEIEDENQMDMDMDAEEDEDDYEDAIEEEMQR